MCRALTLTLLLSFSLNAADQVVLTNGDTITGTIIKKDGDKLTIKSEFLGEVSMPWTAVKTLRSESEVFVQLASGETVKGKVQTSGDQLEVAGLQAKTAPMTEVAAVRDEAAQHSYERLQSPRLVDLWQGNFDIGFALARGNARADTLTTGFNANRVTRNDKLTLRFTQIYSTARVEAISSTTASAIRGGWRYDRDVSPKLFLTVFNDWEHDRFQNLDLRGVFGGGGGYRAAKRENFTLDLDAGADYNRENFLNGVHRNSAEAVWGDVLFYRLAKATSINQSFHMFNNLTNTGEYRINADLSIVNTLRRWLSFQITASDRFLSNPVSGRGRNDILLSTGLRVSFAR
jgi:putative salt-induced outer membrane protein YdiY